MAQSRLEGDKIGKNQKVRQLQNYTPEQMEIQARSEGRVGAGSYLDRLASGEEGMFNEIEAPAYRQFNEQMGNTASRFSQGGGGQGAIGGRRSSGFQNTASAASSNFAQDLQARRMELTRNAQHDLFNMSQGLLSNKPYERWVEENQDEGFDWGGLAGGAGGAIIGGLTGGPAGAFSGGLSGYNSFKRGSTGGGGGGSSPGYGGGQSGGFGDWQNMWNKATSGGSGEYYPGYKGSGPHYNFPGA